MDKSDRLLRRLSVASNGVPIYVQLREQILHALGDGTLAPSARLPTMRQVAVALKVDLNTVQHAYATLEREGVLSTTRGRGSFVAPLPPPVDPARRKAAADGLAYKTIATARSLGIDPVEVGGAILRIAHRSSPQPRRKS